MNTDNQDYTILNSIMSSQYIAARDNDVRFENEIMRKAQYYSTVCAYLLPTDKAAFIAKLHELNAQLKVSKATTARLLDVTLHA